MNSRTAVQRGLRNEISLPRGPFQTDAGARARGRPYGRLAENNAARRARLAGGQYSEAL